MMHWIRPAALRLSAALALALAAPGLAPAVTQDGSGPEAAEPPAWAVPGAVLRPSDLPVFERPRYEQVKLRALQLLMRGDHDKAAALAGTLARSHPAMWEPKLLLALAEERRGRPERAAEALRAAVADGWRADPGLADAPELRRLRGRPELREILEAAMTPPPEGLPPPRRAAPAPIRDGEALVAEENTVWDPRAQELVSLFDPPARGEGRALSWFAPEPQIRELARLIEAGEAAGGWGDYYDNLDGDHAALKNLSPGAARVRYAPAAQAAGLARGTKAGHRIEGAVAGNSSTVTGGPLSRSMARFALTRPGGPALLWRRYVTNQVHAFPEHKDHDPLFGDLFPALTPYQFVSQGSSSSEKFLVTATLLAWAALKPEVKDWLREEDLLAPVGQWIVRRSMTGVGTEFDFTDPRAHPTVFGRDMLDWSRVIPLAQEVSRERLPMVGLIRVMEEPRPVPRVDVYGDGLDERLFDTPAAVARIARGRQATRRYRFATAVMHPSDRPVDDDLEWRWVVLRGDPEKVRVTPEGPDGAAAVVEIDWHDERVPAQGRGDVLSNRVDIAVFPVTEAAGAGMPAYFSLAFPPRQRRGVDAEGRTAWIDFDPAELADRDADPLLYPRREWRDDYEFDDRGRLLGWTRTFEADGGRLRTARYTRHGAVVLQEDALGRPLVAQVTAYPVEAAERGRRRVTLRPGDELLEYVYDGDDDRMGRAIPAEWGRGGEE